jgi:hypothetical protein
VDAIDVAGRFDFAAATSEQSGDELFIQLVGVA